MSSRTRRWIDRTLLESQCVALCLNERQFHSELRKLKIAPKSWPSFRLHGHAATHFFESDELGRLAIVCMGSMKGRSLEQIHALLVHEAVHIWRDELKWIKEDAPGEEIEAYGIQNIAQALMVAYRGLAR